MTSSINKPRPSTLDNKPRRSALENHIQAQIDSFKKSIPTYTADDPIRTYMENQITKLEKELEQITFDEISKMSLGVKTP